MKGDPVMAATAMAALTIQRHHHFGFQEQVNVGGAGGGGAIVEGLNSNIILTVRSERIDACLFMHTME